MKSMGQCPACGTERKSEPSTGQGNGGSCWIRTSDQLVKSLPLEFVFIFIFQLVTNLICPIKNISHCATALVLRQLKLIYGTVFTFLFPLCQWGVSHG